MNTMLPMSNNKTYKYHQPTATVHRGLLETNEIATVPLKPL
jgi:hypothetical protein